MDLIRKFLRQDRDSFANNTAEIRLQNSKVLKSACIVYLLILAVFTVITVFTTQSQLLISLYFIFDALHLALCFLVFRDSPLKDGYLRRMDLCRILFELTLLGFFLLEAVFPFPAQSSLYFPFPIILLVIVFTFPVKQVAALILSYVSVFLVLVFLYKTPEAQAVDLYIAAAALVSATTGYLIVASLRHETNEALLRLRGLSMTDTMTGLYNKHTFESLCRAFIENNTDRGYALLFADLDRFKQINDQFGHPAGDAVLSGVGAVMRETFYEKDFLCRFGGDEFVIFMVDIENKNDVRDRITILQEKMLALSKRLKIDDLSCSVGVAMKAKQPESYVELLSRADAALYLAKKNGGQQVGFAESAAQPGEKIAPPLQAGAGSQRALLRRVLVVDDNAVNRQILRKILSFNYEVLEAENGKEALDLLGRIHETVSAVLLDLVMPVMDGYEALTRMRADERLSAIPVIVTTATLTDESEIRALSLGANDYIVKPYRPAIIMRRLENTINLRESTAILSAAESRR